MKALGESWERTSGNEFQILGAALALLILPIAVMIACSILFEPGQSRRHRRHAARHERDDACSRWRWAWRSTA